MMNQQGGAITSPPDQHDLQLSSSEHGHLVQQILDSQKEFSQITGKTEIVRNFIFLSVGTVVLLWCGYSQLPPTSSPP